MMPSSRDSEKPRVSLGLTEIEEEGRREIKHRAREVAKHVTDGADPTYVQYIQKLDVPTLRYASALLAARLRKVAKQLKPDAVCDATAAKPSPKKPAAVKATSKASKPATKAKPRARRQSSDWRQQCTTRPSYASRARRLGLLIAAISTALAVAALRIFH